MRLLHLGDLHLGKMVLETPMLEDQRDFLQQTAAYAAENAIDAVLLAGDIYDRSVPAAAAVEVLDDFLHALHEAGIPVLAVSGNHDSPERLAFGSRLFARQGVYVAGLYNGTVSRVDFTDAYGRVAIHLLPFLRPVFVREALGAACASTDEAVRIALAEARLEPETRHVLVAHQFVCAGGLEPETCDSETLSVGGSDAVDAAAFDGFDYVALGHLHRAQRVGRDTVRYAGSPLCYSLSEIGRPKSFPVVTLAEKGTVEVELIPIVPRRSFRRIEGTLSELISAGQADAEGRDDYIWAVLPAEERHPAQRLRAVYPHLLHIEVAASFPEETDSPLPAFAENPSPEELFGAFYTHMTGHPLDGEQRAVLQETLRRIDGEEPERSVRL